MKSVAILKHSPTPKSQVSVSLLEGDWISVFFPLNRGDKNQTNLRAQGQVVKDREASSLECGHPAKPRTGFITQPWPDIWWRSMKWHIYFNCGKSVAGTLHKQFSLEDRKAFRVGLEASARQWLPVDEPVRVHVAPSRSFTSTNPLEPNTQK